MMIKMRGKMIQCDIGSIAVVFSYSLAGSGVLFIAKKRDEQTVTCEPKPALGLFLYNL